MPSKKKFAVFCSALLLMGSTLTVITTMEASAATANCGGGFHRADSAYLTNSRNTIIGEVVLYKKNLPGAIDNWCAVTYRLNARGNRGTRGNALVVISIRNGANQDRDRVAFEYYAGPVKAPGIASASAYGEISGIGKRVEAN